MAFHISLPSAQALFVDVRAQGLRIANATAFVVRSASGRPFLVTNRHVATGRDQNTDHPLDKATGAIPDELVVWHNSRKGLGLFLPVSVQLQKDGLNTWHEHPTLGPEADLVAFAIEDHHEAQLFPFELDGLSHNRMHPSQRISVVGFPFGQRTGVSFAIWATGFVASEPEVNHGGRPVFLIDCRTRKGQSGAPVVYHEEIGAMFLLGDGPSPTQAQTQLLGIYSGRINEQSDIGTVWKTYAITELVEAAAFAASAA